MTANPDTHSKTIGYLLWIFGFMGAHRFYYGRQLTGTLWFFTLGLFFVGWIIDLFLIPGMDRDADRRYVAGRKSYNVSWVLLTFLGIFGTPMATANSPTCGHPKFPQARRLDYEVSGLMAMRVAASLRR